MLSLNFVISQLEFSSCKQENFTGIQSTYIFSYFINLFVLREKMRLVFKYLRDVKACCYCWHDWYDTT